MGIQQVHKKSWNDILSNVGVSDPHGTECNVADMLHKHMSSIAKKCFSKAAKSLEIVQSIKHYRDLGFTPFFITDSDGYSYIFTVTEGRLLHSLQRKIVEQLLLKD